MYYYFPTSSDQLAQIRQSGIDYQDHFPLPLSDNFHDFQPLPEGCVLVIRAADLESNYPSHIAPDAIVNLSPYTIPRTIVAGGGYVLRDQNGERQVLLIKRRGLWDLPKGKQEKGESDEETALREVQEEVGIGKLTLLQPLSTTFHGYPHRKGVYFDLKTTHWYAMTTPETNFTPQTEEDIEAVAWFSLHDAQEHLGYDTLKSHLAAHLEVLSNVAL